MRLSYVILMSAGLFSSGCIVLHHPNRDVPSSAIPGPAPRELQKAILPDYTIEPPDILVIDAINLVPRAPYLLRTLDSVNITVAGTVPDAPIEGTFAIELGGMINLGFPYGSVKVAGLTVEEARLAIDKHLRQFLAEPQMTVSLLDMAALQHITGEHLVGPDGKVTLGGYGSVSVVGNTIAGAKWAIEEHLGQFLENPDVSVNVFAYNSKVYYIVYQGAGLGDTVYRLPVTGNETVLDALAQINGLDQVSSKHIWIARPGRNEAGYDQILPVDWLAITQMGRIDTNYQVLPGDRIYVAENKLIAFDNELAKFTAPLERIMGFALLGVATATRFSGKVLRGGGDQRGRF